MDESYPLFLMDGLRKRSGILVPAATDAALQELGYGKDERTEISLCYSKPSAGGKLPPLRRVMQRDDMFDRVWASAIWRSVCDDRAGDTAITALPAESPYKQIRCFRSCGRNSTSPECIEMDACVKIGPPRDPARRQCNKNTIKPVSMRDWPKKRARQQLIADTMTKLTDGNSQADAEFSALQAGLLAPAAPEELGWYKKNNVTVADDRALQYIVASCLLDHNRGPKSRARSGDGGAAGGNDSFGAGATGMPAHLADKFKQAHHALRVLETRTNDGNILNHLKCYLFVFPRALAFSAIIADFLLACGDGLPIFRALMLQGLVPRQRGGKH